MMPPGNSESSFSCQLVGGGGRGEGEGGNGELSVYATDCLLLAFNPAQFSVLNSDIETFEIWDMLVQIRKF
jgi:hypothetical protein